MILVITPSEKAQACADAVKRATNQEVEIASTLRQATVQLRTQEYEAVVIDQFLVDAEPDESDLLVQHVEGGIPVYVNFAISGVERVVRELRAALNRRRKEVLVARKGAEMALRSELKGNVTALLLSCEMALNVPNLPSAAEAKIRAVYDLAKEIRLKVGLQSEPALQER
ncbi:MAG TPA: hypothetical protein VFA68_19130 [Terriglobales bacterium]|nr:hypothetical protein [Terriglobales bacterium]